VIIAIYGRERVVRATCSSCLCLAPPLAGTPLSCAACVCRRLGKASAPFNGTGVLPSLLQAYLIPVRGIKLEDGKPARCCHHWASLPCSRRGGRRGGCGPWPVACCCQPGVCVCVRGMMRRYWCRSACCTGAACHVIMPRHRAGGGSACCAASRRPLFEFESRMGTRGGG